MAKRKRKVDQSADEHDLELSAESHIRPFRRAFRGLLIVFALLLILVAMAPNLVGWLGMHQSIVNRLSSDFPGEVRVGSASIGWFQPLNAHDIRVTDEQGQTLIAIDSIRSSRSLLSLLFHRQDLGEFHIQRPQINARMRPGSSDWEDIISAWVNVDQETPSTPLPRVTLLVSDGRLELSGDQAETITCANVRASLTIGGEASALTANAEADVLASVHQGRIAAEFALDPNQASFLGEQGTLVVRTQNLPATVIEPIAERLGATLSVQGMVHADLRLEFMNFGEVLKANIEQCRVVGLSVSSLPESNDALRLNSLVASGQLAFTPTELVAQGFSADSDAGRLAADGHIEWSVLFGQHNWEAKRPTNFRLEGQLELAALAKMFSEQLGLYRDVQVESGQIWLQIASHPGASPGEVFALRAELDVSNLTARRQGERLTWARPLRMGGVVKQTSQGTELEQVAIESDFLRLVGRANWQSGDFTIQCDLQRFVEEWSQLVDLSAWELAGRMGGHLQWQLGASGANELGRLEQEGQLLPLQLTGSLTVADPVVSIPAFGSWRDRTIEVAVESRGAGDIQGNHRIDESRLVIKVGHERLELNLISPVEVARTPTWVFAATGSGSLARWLAHLRTVAPIPDMDLDGHVEATGQLTWSSDSIQVHNLAYIIRQFAMDGFGMRIREHELNGTGQVSMDWLTGDLNVHDLTLVSSTVAARGMPLAVSWSPAMKVEGVAVFRADVERTLAWFGMVPAEGAVLYSGQCEGTLRAESLGDQTLMHVDIRSPQILAAQWSQGAWRTLIQEPNLAVNVRSSVNSDWSQIVIQEASLQAPSVIALASGTLTDVTNSMNVDLNGSWRPDWQRISALLAAYTGDQVKLVGRDEQAFQIRGPLIATETSFSDKPTWPPDDLEIIAQLGWQEAEVYRLPVRSGRLTAKLARGIIHLDTGRVDFSGGTLNLAPTIDLRQPEWVTVFGQGRFARDIVITPEICREWMKYFAPILADVTTTQGRFSMQTGGAMVPLNDPAKTTGQGAILLHDVTVGAGPLGRQLIGAINQLRTLIRAHDAGATRDDVTWIRMSEQTVPFTIRDGRVYHSNLEFTIQDFVVKSRGSVGFDQSLSLIVEIPIAERWIEGQPLLSFLKGKSLSLPIGGSLAQPRVDHDALQQLLRQIVQPMAANALPGLVGGQTERLQERAEEELQRVQDQVLDKVENELRRGLDRLIRPRRDQQ
ncbi:MAG TPA: hypothetical protein PKD54_02805 [Pirellulaceae bacterium]|nr:hypothetical protein [Pirellulaceae bacterium]